jgi:hypothetical protein
MRIEKPERRQPDRMPIDSMRQLDLRREITINQLYEYSRRSLVMTSDIRTGVLRAN